MNEQNYKVMQMSDAELQEIIQHGDKKTFLHFQANREYNARYNGGRRKGEITPKEFLEGMPDYKNYF